MGIKQKLKIFLKIQRKIIFIIYQILYWCIMKYRKAEMLDSIEVSNNFESISDKIKDKSLRKVVVTRNS